MVDIETALERRVFEGWIADELEKIESCVDTLLMSSGTRREEVDAVFLTGGSSLVPAVRRIFESRFGADKIRAGNEFTSVAHGLALEAGNVFPSRVYFAPAVCARGFTMSSNSAGVPSTRTSVDSDLHRDSRAPLR